MARDLRLLIVDFWSVGQALASLLQYSREEPRGGVRQMLAVGIADGTSSVFRIDGLDVTKAISLKKIRLSAAGRG